jgi:transposase
MAAPQIIKVNESVRTLKQMLKHAKPLIAPRLRMLIQIKQNESTGISKRELAARIGANHNSIQTWRTLYRDGGINALTSHKKVGFKKPLFTEEQHGIIEAKLHDPLNGLRGYKELLEWIETEFGKEYKYNTILKYCRRKFNSRVKVARKSHVNKDEAAVEAFKKTSYITVSK